MNSKTEAWVEEVMQGQWVKQWLSRDGALGLSHAFCLSTLFMSGAGPKRQSMGCHERGIHLGGAQGGPGIVALWPNAHLTSVSSPEWAESGMKLPVWETTGDPEAKGRKSPAGAH